MRRGKMGESDSADFSKLMINGLTQLELRELEEKLGKEIEEMSVSSGSAHNEPATLVIAAVLISARAIEALTIILMRRIHRRDFGIDISRETKDERLVIKIHDEDFSSDAPKKEIIAALIKALALDPKVLLQAVQKDK
jgi:hypothetical protein